MSQLRTFLTSRPWVYPTALLCTYGFFKEMRPSEAFLTPYLKNDKNLTEEEVDNQVYPVWTYSYLAALFFVFIVTDLLRYKPVIIFEAITYIITWAMLIWGQGVLTMQFMQFAYGLATATEIAYYSYIYAVVESEHYQKVTSYTRSAILTGRFMSGLVGQLLRSLTSTTYFALNCISMGSVFVALVISWFLPSVTKSVYFNQGRQQVTSLSESNDEQQNCNHVSDAQLSSQSRSDQKCLQSQSTNEQSVTTDQEPESSSSWRGQNIPTLGCEVDASSIAYSIESYSYENSTDVSFSGPEIENEENIASNSTSNGRPKNRAENERETGGRHKCCSTANIEETFQLLWRDFINSYSNLYLLKWSVWWAFATCGNFQVGNYIQNLWDVISPSRENPKLYNGAVEAASTLTGALIAFGLAYIKANWKVYGEIFLAIVSIGDAVLLLFMSRILNIWTSYGFYVLFRASYQMVITVASFQVASQLAVQRYALVFGVNTFLALLLQTILTAIVVDKAGLDLPVQLQFVIYAVYFFVIGAAFLVRGVYTLVKHGCRCRTEPYHEMDECG